MSRFVRKYVNVVHGGAADECPMQTARVALGMPNTVGRTRKRDVSHVVLPVSFLIRLFVVILPSQTRTDTRLADKKYRKYL